MVHAALSVLLFLSGALCASSKRLIAFGDSITDNGNGTNLVVQAFYSKLLGQPVTAVGHALTSTFPTLYFCGLCWRA